MVMAYGQLNDKGINDAIQRRLQLPPGFDLSLMPELSLTMPLGDATPELYYHMRWRRWQVGRVIPAVAAVVGRFQIRNRDATATNIGTICVVESIYFSSVANAELTGDFGYGPAALDLATPQNAEPRDTRQTPSANSVAVVSQETGAIVASTAVDLLVPANTPVAVPGGPWVLLPGGVMLFSGSVLNSGVTYTIVWRERPLLDQENTA